jgi:hypothetical protein|tara:strand:+ start:1077 stop:1322 length:246 start_codon:yes stop_codon:yes gene_type:complete
MMKKELIDETTSFPALDIKSGNEVYLDCTDDLVLDVIHHNDEVHPNGYNVMVEVNQPSRNIKGAEMLVVSVDVDDWEDNDE